MSKASARQRRGRAGRVRSGYCFHLFSSVTYEQLDDYTPPEMLRVPLDGLCLQARASGRVTGAAPRLRVALHARFSTSAFGNPRNHCPRFVVSAVV